MTLLELAIAASLLSIAVLALFSTLVTSECMTKNARESNIAVFELQSLIEEIRGTPFDAIADSYPDGQFVAAYDTRRLNEERIRVDYVDTAAEPLDITLTITWRNYQGRNVTMNMRTLVAR
jgi:Tfp pilus assembly protein PilV